MTQREADKLFKQHSYYIDIFGQRVSVFLTIEDYEKALDWRGEPKNASYGSAHCVHSILINEKRENSLFMIGWFTDDVSSLIHEIVHIAIMLCDYIGHTITPTDEIVPYITQLLFSKFKEIKDEK